ncbi:MAG TPA: SUMF1/EgtB/PvdO family nonheme iron enzyme, partial [Caldilineaceae bacterium]|nr:SUMF1/EgtB/PvdO family nonheme iron enzyme [Caldilineaceae bacterium]
AGLAVPPLSFVAANGQPDGFEIDLVREFARRWLGDEAAVDFVPLAADQRVTALAGGQVDLVAAALVHTRQQDEMLDFSQSYWLDDLALLARSDRPLASLADLNGRSVAGITGSAALAALEELAARTGITVTVQRFAETGAAEEALRTGQVDALAGSAALLANLAQREPAFTLLSERLGAVPYAVGLPKNDDRLRDLVNFTMQEMKLDGSYDRLTAKWFGPERRMAVEQWPGRSYLPVNLTPMRRIPAGEFLRGNNNGFPDERHEQVIQLDEFYIDQYEVTNRLYAQCVAVGQCTLPRLPRSVNFASYYAESLFGNYPVIWVSWQDAANYCQFAGKRLPSEAEWEKAARGGQSLLYPWGDNEPTTEANFNYISRDVAPVGAYPADVSLYGVYDLAGNVREWVADWYQWDYYASAPAHNPAGPATGVTRVLRGGSWNDVAVYLRTTVRKNYLPDSYDSNLGFRCASSALPLR